MEGNEHPVFESSRPARAHARTSRKHEVVTRPGGRSDSPPDDAFDTSLPDRYPCSPPAASTWSVCRSRKPASRDALRFIASVAAEPDTGVPAPRVSDPGSIAILRLNASGDVDVERGSATDITIPAIRLPEILERLDAAERTRDRSTCDRRSRTSTSGPGTTRGSSPERSAGTSSPPWSYRSAAGLRRSTNSWTGSPRTPWRSTDSFATPWTRLHPPACAGDDRGRHRGRVGDTKHAGHTATPARERGRRSWGI